MENRIRKGAAIVFALLLLFSSGCKKAEEEVSSGPTIGYAFEGVTVIDDTDSLQAAVDEMMEKENQSLSLNYKTTAYSMDGINFDCLLGNSADNTADMYVQIFGDQALQDELFLSGLIRPGQAFEHITLNHALKPGNNPVYCAFTLVRTEEDGRQVIDNQVTLELEFVVAID